MFPVTQSTGFIIGTRLHTVIGDARDVKAQKGKVRRSGESPARDGEGKPMRSPWRALASASSMGLSSRPSARRVGTAGMQTGAWEEKLGPLPFS